MTASTMCSVCGAMDIGVEDPSPTILHWADGQTLSMFACHVCEETLAEIEAQLGGMSRLALSSLHDEMTDVRRQVGDWDPVASVIRRVGEHVERIKERSPDVAADANARKARAAFRLVPHPDGGKGGAS